MDRRHARGALFAAFFTSAFAVVVLRSAWIHDDAYITFRTVDNFVNGYGPRWNVAERVQAYTHPLWMLIVSGCYALTHELFYTVIALSVALSLATAFLLVFSAAGSMAGGLLAVATLTLSKAFVDYSTSGLENPLTHFLLVAFLVVFCRRPDTHRTLYLLSTLAALAAVNRLDSLLLYIPAIAFVALRAGAARGFPVVVAGFAPLIIWQLFSLVYYGFPFPNTAYAKVLGSSVNQADLIAHGGYYLLNAVRTDPLTPLAIAAGTVAGVGSGDRRYLPVLCGIAVHLLYLTWIGGDFVSGRFLTAPLLASVIVLSRSPWIARHPIAPALVVAAVGFLAPHPPPLTTAADYGRTEELMDAHGVADERPYYYRYAGFVSSLRHVHVSDHPWAIEGRQARLERRPLVFRGDIGYFGFYAGPGVHIVDLWGLADPLVARLPARRDIPWRVGHFTRAIPGGYPETLVSGRNRITDPNLASFYDKLALITRGPIFDAKRWGAIWKMNTGQYQHLIDAAAAN